MGLCSRNKSAGGLGGEEVDSYSDLRLARRWKRRGIVYGNLGINGSRDKALKKTMLRDNGNNDGPVEVVTIDSDDEQPLEGMQLSVDFDGNDDGDVFDPQYMMFLDNLKEDGKSYLLELALVNETSVVEKYEKEDGSTSEVDVDKLETVMRHQKQGKIRTGDALKRRSKREKIEPLRLTLRSHSRREKTENSKRILRSNSQKKNNKNRGIMNDVVKKVKTATPRILRSNSRRENYKSSSDDDYENPNIMNDAVKKVKTVIPRILTSNSRRENYKSSSNDDYENPNNMNDVVKKVQTVIPRILRSNSRRENYKSSSNVGGCSSKRHSSKAANASRQQCNHGVDSDVDESYREFLKLIEGDSDNLVWRPEGGKKVVYAKSDSDSEAEKEGPVSSAENGYPRKRHIPDAANAKSQFNHGGKCDSVVESYQEILKSLKDVEHCDSEIEAEEEAEDPVSPAENGTSMIRHCRKASNSANHQSNHVAKSHSVEESYLEFWKFVKNGRHLEWTPEDGKRIIYEESDHDSEAGAGQEAEYPVSSENGCSSKSQNPEATNSAKHQCNHGVMSDLEDQSYQDFLKFVKNGQRLEYTPEGGEKVTYEESDSDSEVMILDNNLFSDGKSTPVVYVDLDGEECIENHSGCKESAFRAELMEILRRPYDVLEYEKLWQNASYKSPLQGVRVLRKRDKSYPLPYCCKSYLDIYSDLASVINHSQPDKLRILNLLRGFFYWLQNVAREGSFKPWLDSSCLSTLPPVPLTVSTPG